MSQMTAAIERLQFAVRTLPSILSRFSEVESERQDGHNGPIVREWSR